MNRAEKQQALELAVRHHGAGVWVGRVAVGRRAPPLYQPLRLPLQDLRHPGVEGLRLAGAGVTDRLDRLSLVRDKLEDGCR